MSVSFDKNGVVSSDNLYDYNNLNIAYSASGTSTDGISYIYTPSTEVNSCIQGYRIQYDDVPNCRRFKIIIDVEWSGFDTSNTSGTFGMWWQGVVYDRKANTWVWKTNTCCNELNKAYRPNKLVLSAESGNYRYETVFTISDSTLASYSMARVGLRTDYSNGTGWIRISNIQVVPFLDNTYEMKVKTLDDGSEWARIHWLDVSSTVEWFADANEVAYCVNKSNRYSRMGNVDEFKDANGVYEFMLTYPSLSDTLYNRWTQTSSPNETTVTGFTEITTAWSARNGGLHFFRSEPAIYCTDPVSDNWFGAIGQFSSWESNKYIPAANTSSQTSTELWVRIDTLPKKLKVFKNLITANDFIEL